MRPASGWMRPASSRSSVVFPEPLSPTSTRTAPASASSEASSEKPPSRLATWTRSMGPGAEPPRRGRPQPEQETEGHEQQQDREQHRAVEIGLQRDVDRERHGLGGALEIA